MMGVLVDVDGPRITLVVLLAMFEDEQLSSRCLKVTEEGVELTGW